MTQAISDLDARGFVKVNCEACSRDDVWLRCNACEKSDHFLLDAAGAHCSCGEDYDHATCLCGEPVPAARLSFVPFKEGPMSLADLELDPARLALVALVLIGVVGGLWWALG